MNELKEQMLVRNYICGVILTLEKDYSSRIEIKNGFIDGISKGQQVLELTREKMNPSQKTALEGLLHSINDDKEIIYNAHLENAMAQEELPENIPHKNQKYFHAFFHGFSDSLGILTNAADIEGYVLRAMSKLKFK